MAETGRIAARWFRRVLWFGIAVNISLAIPTLIAPLRMAALFNVPIAEPLLWPRFAALLLILLSAFYMPAAVDPHRYRVVAWMAVFARLAGTIFFIGFQSREYHIFGYLDFAFFLPELLLLTRFGLRENTFARAFSVRSGVPQ